MYALEDLWQGKITPSERGYRRGSQYEELMREAIETCDIFYKELSSVGKKAYDAHCTVENKLNDLAEFDSFSRGFRLGMRLLLDAINDDGLPMIQRHEMNTAE
ncbi:MAG: hypothetical protein E7445_05005 [Ruminococcaceae bacterium]|nr:hypothetical protein [Oscillospiraceae bacterium]